MTVRAFWVLVHRYAGLSMAFFLIIAGLTGALLAFYHELDVVLNPNLFQVERRDAPLLGPTALAHSVKAAYPQARASALSPVLCRFDLTAFYRLPITALRNGVS